MAEAQAQPLSQSQFDVLYTLLRAGDALTQRQIQTSTGMSLGRVNAAVRECEAAGYIQERHLTEAGRTALEPYRVDNAVIMAAGLSQRFAPISYERPKGMLRVRDEVLVERQIRQLHEAGITDVTVVVGYKKEYFFYLAEQFDVRIVVNDDYVSRNNNGSLWLVRDILANTFICSSDDYFTDNPFESHVYKAYYSAQYVEGPTEEWCITTGPGDRITDIEVGGSDAWIMLGYVYFDRAFSSTFRRILEEVYHLPETAPKLWEAIYIEHVKELDMVMRRYPEGMINEFDSVDEIRSFDPKFIENVDSEVFDHISEALGCRKTEISGFYPLKQGLTNLSCHFTVDGEEYVYRHPGVGTEEIVDRHAEAAGLRLARELGLDTTFVADDDARGWKISRFVPEARNLDIANADELRQAMRMARSLHTSGRTLQRDFDYIQEALRYEQLIERHHPIDVPDYVELRSKVMRLKVAADADGFERVPSHNDFFPPNFLVAGDGHIDLIDWEYAGMSDIASDFGTLVVCTQMRVGRADEAIAYYFDRIPTAQERRHFWSYVVFAGWCWYVWALAKEAEGDDAGQEVFTYYRHVTDYVDALLSWYEDGEDAVPAIFAGDAH